MILDLAGTISQLVNRVETHQTFIKQQRKYRRDGEIFPRTVEYNSQNLLDIYDAGNYGRFATKVMKILFSSTEMCRSIIYSNLVCAKFVLDPDHM
ncbi:unnamed protein product [Rotaria magnacalcarata]|uniref:Uncharacterized protein n=1 Tax=Rotaria magnacalcarata TaxID=392030 RepID=A0A815PF88_9BILA|nr:unnamed protein product [Rotaria magnacalcarata]